MSEFSGALQETLRPGEVPHLIDETALSSGWRPDSFNSSFCFKDRGLEEHKYFLGFDPATVPVGGRVLVIGSGATRRFERELERARPDLGVVSIDPLLRHGVTERLREAIRIGATRLPKGIDSEGYGVQLPHEIAGGNRYFRPGAIAGGLAIRGTEERGLPLRGQTFDSVVALFSLPMYAYRQEVPMLLRETFRVMKSGARAAFYPFFPDCFWALGSLDSPSIAGGWPTVTRVTSPQERADQGHRVEFQRN